MSSSDHVKRLLEFLETDPNNLRLIQDAADCAYEVGLLDQAITLTTRGLSVDPSIKELQAIQGLAYLAKGEITEATKLFQNLVDQGELSYVIRYNLAYCLCLSAEYAKALPLLEDELAIYAEFPQMLHLKVRALHHLSDVDGAIVLAKSALKINEQDAVLHAALSTLYIDAEDFTLAKQHADQTAKTGNIYPEALTSLGTLALSVQNDTDALAYFDQAISISKRDGRAWLGKALAEMLQQRYSDAVLSFKAALNEMPTHLGTLQALAWCQLVQEDITGAEVSIRHALGIDDTFAESHGVLALIQIMKGELETAKDSIRRALGLNSQSFSGLYARAFLLKQQGRTESSEKLIQGMLDVPLMPDQTTLRDILIKQMGKR